MNIIFYFAMGIFESFLVLSLGLSLINVRMSIKKLLFMSLLLLTVTILVRNIYSYYDISLGTHSFIILFVELIILIFIAKQSLYNGIIAILLSYLVLIICEYLITYNVFVILNADPLALEGNYTLKGFIVLLTNILLLIVFYISYIRGFSIINLSKEAD